jgi:hypothetical protein
MPAEEKPLKVERREEMIDSGQPLGHAVVVSIFRLHSEKVKPAEGNSQGIPRVPAEAEISPGPPQCGITVTNQPHTNVIVSAH